MDDIELVEEGEDPKEKLKKLRDALKVCQKERDEYLAGWQRAKADFINARHDEEKTRSTLQQFATRRILEELLLVADSFDKALMHDASEGTKSMARQFQDLLKKHGVESFESVGVEFDPERHEALEEVAVTNSDQDNVVVEELQKGYIIQKNILRAAKVKVGIYKSKT